MELIDRQAAIDALRYAQHRFTVADEAGGMGTVKWSEDVIYFAAAERVLTDLPSAQPVDKDINVPANDLISRQAAIDAIGRDPMGGLNYERILKYLPTADAVEVVRCKDCAIRFDSCPMVVRVGSFIQFFTDDEDFCSKGRREADGNGQ